PGTVGRVALKQGECARRHAGFTPQLSSDCQRGETMPWAIVFLVVTMILSVHVTWADDAIVLPAGVFRLSADARFSLPITKRFTSNGGTEDLPADLSRGLLSPWFGDL